MDRRGNARVKDTHRRDRGNRLAAHYGDRDGPHAGVTGTVVVSDSGEHPCTGSFRVPTAPPDKVCIYIANADNAADIHGVSISPGSAGVKWGFKLVWSHVVDGEDSFVDATWAYN